VLKLNGETVDPKRQYVLQRGDTVSLATPGGGGHGPLAARAEGAIRADRLAGYIE
jgi:N-methylhydantoinase B